jgi:DNA primase
VDVIALAQAGVKNTVAPLGTALTADQLRLLKRFTDDFVLLFDGDRAGIAAAARSFTVFAEVGLFGDVAFLPEGHDPDTFVQAEGREGVERIVARPSPLIEHYLRSLAPPGASLAVRQRAAETIVSLLGATDSPTFRGLFIRRAADYLNLAEAELTPKRNRLAPRGPADAPVAPRRGPELSVHESLIVELLLTHPELDREMPADLERLLPHEEARSLVRRIREAGHATLLEEFLDELPTDARNRVAKAWLGESELYAEPSRMLADCLARLEQQAVEGELLVLSQAIRDAEASGDAVRLQALLAEKQRLATAARQER